MKEIRIYLADLSSCGNKSKDINNIIEVAEEQGTIWSLQQFAEQFNNGGEPLCDMLSDVSGDVVLKVCLFDDGKFVCEIKENIFGEWSEKNIDYENQINDLLQSNATVEVLCEKYLSDYFEENKIRRKYEDKIEKIKECCNQTIQIMDDTTGTQPYAQGRVIEAKKILEIIEGE